LENVESNYKTLKKLAQIEENKCTNVCNNKKFENYHEQLDALTKYYTDCKNNIGPRIKAVKKALDKVNSMQKAKKTERCEIHCNGEQMQENCIHNEWLQM